MRYPKFKRLAGELASLTRYAFQRRCCDLLRELWPDLVYAKELGNLDTKGIDLYVSAEGLHMPDFDIVVQCKGLELPHFGEAHLRECITSIDKFASCDLRTHSYYLIVNRAITEPAYRDKLEERLKNLIKCRMAATTYLLDLNGFTQFLLNTLREKLLRRIESLDAQHVAQYEEVMGRGIYIDGVPFVEERYEPYRSDQLRPIRQVAKNPHQYLLDRFRRRFLETSEYHGAPKKLWTLVISEFGFGKTCLLLRLGVHLWNAGLSALYVPLVEIPRDAFGNERLLVKSFLRIILGEQGESSSHELGLWAIALSSLLRTRSDFVLLLDGLDERRDAYSHEGIRRIFDCLRDYTCPIVLSMRREFWDERHGNLQLVMRKPVTNRDIIFLSEWDDRTITRYAEEVQSKLSRASPLEEFISLVREGKYTELYGDIPRRPLFLSMLVDDVISGKVQKMTLSHLYEGYVLRKMRYDQESPFGDTSRPLPLGELDFDDLRRRFLLMLERLALKTVVAGEANEAQQLLEKFPEGWVKEAAKLEGLPGDQTISFLMNTILVTDGSRTVSRELDVRFAHRSFQEYFVARRLVNLLKNGTNEEVLYLWSSRYVTGVVMFAEQILRDVHIQPDQPIAFDKCVDRLRRLSSTCQGQYLATDILARLTAP